jgi:uncharacterized membrane protein (DUF4010 family)
VGLEREEHSAATGKPSFGGVRTFPLIGLLGFSIALLSRGQLMPLMVGFVVVASFLLLSYWHKLFGAQASRTGVTSEMSGLTIFLVGALVYYDFLWIATTLAVANLLLLDLKEALEKLAVRIAPAEILAFAKFLLLSAVILPVLPNREFTRFHLNFFETWLVVVAVSGISYGSYVLQKVLKRRSGVLLSSVLGGAYSSTMTTVVMARRSAQHPQPHLYSGAILIASGVMYMRVIVLLTLFNRTLLHMLFRPFLLLAVSAVAVGWFWMRRGDVSKEGARQELGIGNPLELSTAFFFGAVFMGIVVATQLAVAYLGEAGVNTLAAIVGLADVDAFVMGMTQTAGAVTPMAGAAAAIVIAAGSNNLIKGIYAFSIADRRTGVQSAIMLGSLALLGLTPLLWLR